MKKLSEIITVPNILFGLLMLLLFSPLIFLVGSIFVVGIQWTIFYAWLLFLFLISCAAGPFGAVVGFTAVCLAYGHAQVHGLPAWIPFM